MSSIVVIMAVAAALYLRQAPEEPAPGNSSSEPLFGGRVTVHVPALPPHLSYPLTNAGVVREIHNEVHESLLRYDPQTTRLEPNVASAWHVEDLVLLEDNAPTTPGEVEVQVFRSTEDRELVPRRAVYGATTPGPESLTVRAVSPGSDLGVPVTIPNSSVERVETGCVFTFELRAGVRWQTSLVYEGPDRQRTQDQFVDANDVYFSWDIYRNPQIECDAHRFRFQAFPDCRVIDSRTVRFFGAGQSAFALNGLANAMTLLPSHIYNLSDPDCPDHNGEATLSERADHVNVNDHNRLWVGVGPYQVTAFESQYLEAERFVDGNGQPAYFDLDERPGYVDTIRWRAVPGAQQALTALRNGELDFVDRISSADYFGERTNDKLFDQSYRKGVFYLGDYVFVAWNLHNPKLSDLAVRKAIAHAFDLEAYRDEQNQGLGRIVTGPVRIDSDGHPVDAGALEYDPKKSISMLEEAGWYDRNGNGIADKDGVELEIELLFPAGSETFKILARAVQDAGRAVGIQFRVVALEFGSLLERMKERQFEALSLNLIPPLESDPEQLWHSRRGQDEAGGASNIAGVVDAEVDRLIGEIQREVNRDRRMELWKQFHRHVRDEVQPFLFCLNFPHTFAVSQKIHGVESTPIDPGYVIRQWYYTDPTIPSVRATLAKD